MAKSILGLIFLALIIPTSYGLECQQCGQKGNGLCFDFDDNGETVECRDGLDACWLYQIKNEVEGTEETFRSCGTNLEGPSESCFSQTINGDEAVICSCTTDNCNKDNNCDCIPPTNIICQKCDGENGECESTSDNGKSVICAEDEDACFYHSIKFQGGNETVFRDCIKSTPGNGDYCLKDETDGDEATSCSCTTDNCNKDNQCDCNSSSTIGWSFTWTISTLVMLRLK